MIQQETWLNEAVLPPAFIILGNTGDEANDTDTAVSRVTVIANSCYLFQKSDGMYDRTLKARMNYILKKGSTKRNRGEKLNLAVYHCTGRCALNAAYWSFSH